MWRTRSRTFMTVLAFAATISASALAQEAAPAEGNADKGEKLYKRCVTCHTLEESGKHKLGPNLHGIFGSQAGTKEGFRYSKAMIAAGEDGLIWSDETLSQYVKAPKTFIPKNQMNFAGLRKDQQILDLLAYLHRQLDATANEAEDGAPAQ